MSRSKLAVLLAAGLLLGCQGDQATAPPEFGPSNAISDGSTGGNPGFFFLPPIASNPGGEPFYDPELFNRNLSPVVEICALAGGACVGDPVSRFAGDDISVSANHYGVEWDTKRLDLDVNTDYRVQVFVSTLLLGYADVDIVRSNRDKDQVDTQNFVPLQSGKTLPIKFHIEVGAFCAIGADCADVVVGDGGGTVTTPSGEGGAQFPNDWLPDGTDEVLVIIDRVELAPGEVCLPLHLVQFASCYTFTTIPEVEIFENPVVVGMCIDAPEGDPLAEMAVLIKLDEDITDPNEADSAAVALENVAADFITCNTNGLAGTRDGGFFSQVARGGLNLFRSLLSPEPLHAAAIHKGLGGLTTSFSKIGWSVDAEIVIIDGDEQQGSPGGTLPVDPIIQINTLHPRPQPWSDVLVGFRYLDPDQNIVREEWLTTDKLGQATTSWTLTGVGRNRLRILARTLPSAATMFASSQEPVQ